MFLCLKYLPEDLVEPWFRSALEIHDPHWRARLIVWLAGAHQLLTDDIQWPSQFHENARPAVNWDWSHCLRPDMPSADGDGMRPTGPFLPIVARETVLGVCKSYFSDDVYLDWLISIESVANLALELGEIPARFEEMFVGRVNP